MTSEGAPDRRGRDHQLRIVLPLATLALGLLVWDLVVRINAIPPYLLPSPGLVLQTLIADWTVLWDSLLVTLTTTVEGLLLAIIGGVGLAVLFACRFGWRKALLVSALVLPVLLAVFGGRMTDLSATSEGTGQARLQLWRDGMVLFKEFRT